MRKEEMETHVSLDYAAGLVIIYTTVPAHLRRLRKEERARVRKDHGDEATFEVDAADFNVIGGFKRKSKPMTPEQKQAAVERLKKAREARG